MKRAFTTAVLSLLPLAGVLPGCSGMRFVIDTVPAVDAITETTVLEDTPAAFSLTGDSKVALIDVAGLISSTGSAGVLTKKESPVARFAESLRRAADDSKVKALIVRINSPGGTVTASDIMYRELEHFKETTGRPVVVLLGDIAASGGYYLACAGDEIIAHPTTITGSIGVIIQTMNFSEGMRRIGIRAETITSGPNKAAGSPFEPMSAEHRALLQGLVNEFYGQFVGVVETGRDHLDGDDLDWITDGRVVTGRRAAEIGLVDAVGDLRDAFRIAKERAGLNRAKLVKYHRPVEYVGSAFARTPADGRGDALVQLNIGTAPAAETAFYYLWDPTVW